jgi:hypothetical protein
MLVNKRSQPARRKNALPILTAFLIKTQVALSSRGRPRWN